MTCPMSIALHLQALPAMTKLRLEVAVNDRLWQAMKIGKGLDFHSFHQNIVQSCTIQLTCLLMVLWACIQRQFVQCGRMWWEKNHFLPAAFWPEIILINHHDHPWNREMHLILCICPNHGNNSSKSGPKSLNSGLVQIIILQKWWFDIEHISISTRMFDGHCCYRTLFLYLRTQMLHNYILKIHTIHTISSKVWISGRSKLYPLVF